MIIIQNLITVGKFLLVNNFGYFLTHRIGFDLEDEEEDLEENEPECYCSLCHFVEKYCQGIIYFFYPVAFLFIPLKLKKVE